MLALENALYVRQPTDQEQQLLHHPDLSFIRKIAKMKSAITCLVCASLLGGAAAMAADDSTSDSARAMEFMKEAAITTDIKTKLAAEHITSLERIHVDTDKDGVVWLSGTASTRRAADKAVSIARDAEHVKDVHSDITVRSPG